MKTNNTRSPLRRRRRPEAPQPDDKSEPDTRKRAIVLCALALPLLIACYGVVLWWSNPRTPGEELRIDQFMTLLRQGRIQDATILESDNRIVGNFDGGRYWVAYAAGRETLFSRFTGALEEAAVPTSVSQQPLKNLVGPITILLPSLIIIDGLFLLFLLFSRGGNALGAFGRSGGKRVQTGDTKITFSDVAGVDEAIEELAEVRDYLSSPGRFLAMGASVPKGLLLTGPPGCGKTLLARALAGEANVPFFSISGSDFVEIFVGVGAARIRDFFKVAKAAAPCIVFIDELDAVGRGRSALAVGGQDEREATLNQLLVEMDGFESGVGVVVLAATNRPDILDTALLRPGRFDRRVAIDRPDSRGREGILRIHARGKPLAPDADLAALARRTVGFSGADLASVVNEAALLAARRASSAIDNRLLSEAVDRVVAGPERKSRLLSPADRQRIAFHEAGHAVASVALQHTDRVTKLSVVARGHGGGFTWWVPEGDQVSVTRSQILDRIAALLAGRAAEELVFGEASSGAVSDLDTAVGLARRLITEFGMGEYLGPFVVKPLVAAAALEGSTQAYSDAIATRIDEEVRSILHAAHIRATNLLGTHRASLDRVAHELIEAETLEGPELDELLAPIRERAPVEPLLAPD